MPLSLLIPSKLTARRHNEVSERYVGSVVSRAVSAGRDALAGFGDVESGAARDVLAAVQDSARIPSLRSSTSGLVDKARDIVARVPSPIARAVLNTGLDQVQRTVDDAIFEALRGDVEETEGDVTDATPIRVPVLDDSVTGWPNARHALETGLGGEPVESGARITDHAVTMPEKLLLEFWVEELGDEDRQKPEQAWQAVRKVQRDKTLLDVFTPWGAYDRMIIKKVVGDPVGGHGIHGRMELEEILSAEITQASDLPQETAAGPAFERTSEQDRGRITADPIEELELPALNIVLGFGG